MKTLVVDDDPFSLQMLARQLQTLGCQDVVQCNHADQAMLLLQTQAGSIDLVLCDLQMPDIDGVQLVSHLARTGYQGGVAIISSEAPRTLDSVARLAQAHQVRMLGALSKPVTLAQLRGLLDKNAETIQGASKVQDTTGHPSHPHSKPLAVDAAMLAHAITAGQLLNHYQPKVDMRSGRVVGAEALVRWQHPTAGLLPPSHFIDMAQDIALAAPLTRTVLRNALQQCRLWRDAGLDMHVAVNVAMENLAVLDFPETVVHAMAQAGVPPSSLILEVAESRLTLDMRIPLDVLARLHLQHVRLSIDDFGTGHSSFAQLRDLPFDELKLDRGFISGIARQPTLHAIVDGTLSMTRKLGLKSAVEGVEDRADWDVLRGLGCDVAQGYFISPPMPGSHFLAWLPTWEARRAALAPAGLQHAGQGAS